MPSPQANEADQTVQTCSACRNAEPLDFEFEFAYQPIVNFATRSVYAHEALVRGPQGESAASVLAQVTEHNRYRFDQDCRVKAVAGARGPSGHAGNAVDKFPAERGVSTGGVHPQHTRGGAPA